MKRLSYLFFRAFVGLVSIFTFRGIYILSDFVVFILRDVLSYRKEVIRTNLEKSFPEKSKSEITTIYKQYYQHLGDIIIESFKFYSASEFEISARYKFDDSHLLDMMIEQYDGVIVLISHYNNWEWGAPLLKHNYKHHCIGIYSPLNHPIIDKYVYGKRSQYGTIIYPSKQTLRVFNAEKNSKPIYFLVADQSPSNLNKVDWINFLNQETAFLNGPEKIAKKYSYPVLYLQVNRVDRGCYNASLELLMEDVHDESHGSLTTKYAQHLESIIKDNPVPWLWSHRRWKHRKSNG